MIQKKTEFFDQSSKNINILPFFFSDQREALVITFWCYNKTGLSIQTGTAPIVGVEKS